jgi:manganese transport protein
VSTPALDNRPTLKRRYRPPLAVFGPAFVAAVAYVDPGNVATNLQAGARYAYTLVWVLVVAIASAGIVQYLSAKLGVITGKSLPELVGQRLPRPWRLMYWLQAEAVAMATDLAEVIGGAIALNLLFDLPLVMGGLIAGVVSLALLLVQDRAGQRPFERVITGLLLIIAIGFVAGLFFSPPNPADVAAGLIPQFVGMDSVLLATAMLGATVMPHVVYLHSALTRDRFASVALGEPRRRLLAGTRLDVTIGMIMAGGVNICMLLLAASALRNQAGVDTIAGAHAAVVNTIGPTIGVLFGIGLLASGLASTAVGCYAGSVIMEGLLKIRISLVVRRSVTLVPALIILAVGAEPTTVLVISQVVLSFGLPFVLIPLIRLTSDKRLMGSSSNSLFIRTAAWFIAALIITLNLVLIYGVLTAS